MKFLNIYKGASKTVCSALLCAGVLSASFTVQAADIQYPSQKPLSLTEGVPPNLLVTLDDSGSMAWSYAPDAISGNSANRAGRSNTFNPMYYSPDVTYRTPKKISFSGGQVVVKDYVYGTDYSFTSAPVVGFSPTGTKTNLETQYRVMWSNNTGSTSCPSGVYTSGQCNKGNTHAHYFEYNVSGACPDAPAVSNANSCYTYKKVETDAQKKNFAIWYSFYRNRNLATRSSANLAFYTMPDNVRLTWGALNSCNMGSNSSGNCNSNKMDRFTGAHRTNFFKWIDTFPASGGTPLHRAMYRAGEFVKGETSDKSVCRANYHVLMTDGMWNGRANDQGNADSIAKTLPDGTAYTGVKAPY